MIVALDTSTAYTSLALHDGLQVRVEYTWESPRRHTVELASRLASALKRLGLTPQQLKGVAVTTGPGSFSGLRVGMALAKGIALANNLPIIGVPTLDVVATAQGADERPLCAVLQAGRGRICVAFYRWREGNWRPEEGPRLTTWSALWGEIAAPTLFCGEIDEEGARMLSALGERAVLLPAAARLRRAGYLAEIAWRRLERGEVDDLATLVPLYLH